MNSLRVLLIRPPMLLPRSWKGFLGRSAPIGLASVAAVVERAGAEVCILDASIEDWKSVHPWGDGLKKYVGLMFEEIGERVKAARPDLVGITGLSVDARPMLRVAAAIKKAVDVPVIVGGAHATVRYEEMINDPAIDFVCIGEGENVIAELIRSLRQPVVDFSGIRGLAWKKNGAVIINQVQEPIADLDSLPLPSRHLFNHAAYKAAADHFQASRASTKTSAGIFTSRGCPFDCQFCSIKLTMGRKWRPRSVETVVAEIGMLVKERGVEHIQFEDDNLTARPERFLQILEQCAAQGLRFTWDTPNGVRADTLTREHIAAFKKSGCLELVVSPESGCQRVVNEVIGKRLDLHHVEQVIDWCVEAGINISAYHVIGLIGESREEILQTERWTRAIRRRGAHPYCFIAFPYYGTRLYVEGRKNGYILVEDGEELEYAILNQEAVIKTPAFDPAFLYKVQARIQGFEELGRIVTVFLNNPLVAMRGFLAHPVEILMYLIKKYVVGIVARM